VFLLGTRSLLARSDELKTDAVTALQHVIHMQSGESYDLSHLHTIKTSMWGRGVATAP